MKVKVLLRSYLQLLFQNFLYLTMLFGLIVFGLTADHLLGISSIKKYCLLMLGTFFVGLFTTMNLYYNDSKKNIYLKQKVNSHWADVLSQFLVSLIINIFSGILVLIFSLIMNQNLFLDTVGMIALTAVGLLGSSIATLFQTQWYNHPSLGQFGVLVFVYLALTGSIFSFMHYVEFILPPLSKMIMTLQNEPAISQLLLVSGQTFLYALILFLISAFLYKKNKRS